VARFRDPSCWCLLAIAALAFVGALFVGCVAYAVPVLP
jgi:hypothetical protein